MSKEIQVYGMSRSQTEDSERQKIILQDNLSYFIHSGNGWSTKLFQKCIHCWDFFHGIEPLGSAIKTSRFVISYHKNAKFFLEQATTAKKGSRGIALLFY